MNLVERFFGELTPFISEKSFASTRELAEAIITFLTERNDNPTLRLDGKGRRHLAQNRCGKTCACRPT